MLPYLSRESPGFWHFSRKIMHKIWWKKIFPDLLLKNHNWAYLWIDSLKFYTVCVSCMPNCGLSKDIKKLSCRPPAFASYKAFFKKSKIGVELFSQSHFLHDFLHDACYNLLTNGISLPENLPLLRGTYFARYWAICVL